MTDELLPPFEAMTPGGGAYLNEADPDQPNFQYVFYHDNYQALVAIKEKYDPHHMFYASTGVGSEHWTEMEDKRLCSTSF